MTSYQLVDASDYILTAVLILILAVLWKRLPTPNFLALCMGTALSVSVGEIGCRMLDLGSPKNIERVRWSEDRAEGQLYSYAPNGKLVYEYPDNPRGYFDEENKVVGTINSLGFRGTAKEVRKPAGRLRVAFLGDSFTLGFGVKDEHTLASQFEAFVAEEHDEVEVLNFGVTNTSTQEQLDLLENYVLSFSPDVVVIVTFLNDTERIGTLDFMGLRVFPRVRRRSFLFNAVVSKVEGFVVGRVMVAHYRSGYREDNSSWTDVKAALEAASELARSADVHLVVAIYPILIQLGENYPFRGIHETIARYCRSIGVEVVDLLDAFGDQDGSELWVHRSDQHPNEVAHGLAAEWLAKAITARGLLDARMTQSAVP